MDVVGHRGRRRAPRGEPVAPRAERRVSRPVRRRYRRRGRDGRSDTRCAALVGARLLGAARRVGGDGDSRAARSLAHRSRLGRLARRDRRARTRRCWSARSTTRRLGAVAATHARARRAPTDRGLRVRRAGCSRSSLATRAASCCISGDRPSRGRETFARRSTWSQQGMTIVATSVLPRASRSWSGAATASRRHVALLDAAPPADNLVVAARRRVSPPRLG